MIFRQFLVLAVAFFHYNFVIFLGYSYVKSDRQLRGQNNSNNLFAHSSAQCGAFLIFCISPMNRMSSSNLGLIFFDGFESPIHLSIIFAYSWSSQNPGNLVRKNKYWQKLVEISPENT